MKHQIDKVPKVDSNADTKSDGNHTKPLQTNTVRQAATAEQSQLQRNADSLPAVGYPTKRRASSATKNPEDPILPAPVDKKK